ncbi:MAG TPA: aminotransferase class III-fold pyridoxal phosphate-dependent enzyme [Actinophytocola sp.]|uniref:aspartate aminotransferase family protein n=1 Tax=Actinophytocola sp. TaxID=1872138 RepID=UPI002DDD01CF|nr:aminotransferase class III-fold pyridoxal phosphate-dependent enzyme [Actinophytocola sp.]HEV2784520.1 aminotransferase class III-fold pyridoxal phosphate-dependent enzyme [Actinophytocola sp.]
MASSLEVALGEARDRFVAANPRSRAAHEEAVENLPGGNSRTTVFYPPFPLTMAGGTGCRLTDVDGHVYVDLLGDYTAGLYGHDNRVIRSAVDEALDAGWGFGAQCVHEARLATVLCERFPALDLVRFTNSGTEANLLALATATAHTGRGTILVFAGAYHGSVLYFGEPAIPINVPHRFVVGEYNDAGVTGELIDRHAADLAAILVEPMIGSGGCIPGDPAFLAFLRRRADETGALLVFDEVMTSRMSRGGMQALLGITPDLMTLGKYTGGGMTFGAFGGRADVMSMYDPRRPDFVPHAGTFNNNVLSMAAGYAGLTRLFPPETSRRLFERGERLRARLNEIGRDHDAAVQWTGLGSMMTVHFQPEPIVAPRDLRPTPVHRELFHLDLLDRGFHLARRGMVALSLDIGTPECDAFCSAFDGFLSRYGPLLSTPEPADASRTPV